MATKKRLAKDGVSVVVNYVGKSAPAQSSSRSSGSPPKMQASRRV
jgi:hypothetical protein